MHDHPAIVFIALLILVYGVFSHLSERSPVTGPMFFVGVGLLFGSAGLDVFELHLNASVVKLVGELTLMLILFVDATLIDWRAMVNSKPRIALRLLAIGLPLCMLLGFLAAIPFFPEMGIWTIALMALILSPTDAALGQAVIKSEKVPESIRRAISIESGLNDGIALPLIFICIAALLAAGNTFDGSGHWLIFTAKQLVLGPVIGGLIGWLGGLAVDKAALRGWMNPTFQRLACLSLAILSYAGAELLGGNGFIAAFCGGLLLGTSTPEVRHRIQEYGEAEGQLLSLFIFLIFGMAAVPAVADNWGISALIYAVLSLTVIRMVPTAISLIGSRLGWPTISFIGWFGPRGIASILYLLIVIGELGFKGYELMYSVVVLTILLSVMLHGLSAIPLIRLYSRTDKNT